MRMKSSTSSGANRRHFLKAVPAAVAAGVAASQLEPSTNAAAIGKDAIACAETVTGVTFSDAEHDRLVGNVSANLENYEALRKVPVDYDVEPAFAFEPYVKPRHDRGAPPALARATPNAKLSIDRPQFSARPADEDLAFLPLTALASLVESRRISSADLTEVYLARLKRHGDTLQCVVTLTEDLARAQAAAADREIRAGRYKGPLHGIPYGIKDLFATKNIRTTWGANPYRDRVPSVDASAVERMRDAGAVLLAKLTTGELAVGDVWFGGKTRNPWDVSRGSSGSSAGPASATAAGLVGFAVGTETGGSIISPAQTCGVVGLRPTYGRSSRYGCMTLRWTMDKVGPLARGVEDCAIVLNALYGPDGRDRTVADIAFTWKRGIPLSSLTIGVVEEEFETAPDGPGGPGSTDARARWTEEQPLLKGAVDALRQTGAKIRPVRFPALPAQAIYATLNAEAGAAFDDLVRAGRVGELTGKGPNDRANQLRASRFIPAVEYVRAQRIRALLGRQMEDVFDGCDAIVTPSTSPSVTITNLTGHPAVTVNAGFARGLPVGVMLTGRLYDEAVMLAIALAYERARGAFAQRPRLQTTD
jgi:Asp-tRNA(Asn)/Glu-tRNA(Gln) amidotransferase A subunit family amidase